MEEEEEDEEDVDLGARASQTATIPATTNAEATKVLKIDEELLDEAERFRLFSALYCAVFIADKREELVCLPKAVYARSYSSS